MVNHDKKFIFLHIPKCAGTSIGRELNAKFNKDEVYEGFKIHHDDLDEKILNEYFVFTIIRNPWDRLFSQYKYRPWLNSEDFDSTVFNLEEKFEKHYNKSVRNISKDLIPNLDTAIDRANWYDEFVHIPSQVEFLKGKYNDGINKLPYVDFFGTYEHLNQSWHVICSKLFIPYKPLPITNISQYSKIKNYKMAYTEKAKNYVAHKYKKDIKLFNYEF